MYVLSSLLHVVSTDGRCGVGNRKWASVKMPPDKKKCNYPLSSSRIICTLIYKTCDMIRYYDYSGFTVPETKTTGTRLWISPSSSPFKQGLSSCKGTSTFVRRCKMMSACNIDKARKMHSETS